MDNNTVVTYRCGRCGAYCDLDVADEPKWKTDFQANDDGVILCDELYDGDCCGGIIARAQEGAEVRVYMNLYSIYDRFGGAEEGGWWYSGGDAIGCIPLPATWTPTQQPDGSIALRLKIKPVHEEWAFNCLNLTACNNTQDYRIATEPTKAEDYPRKKPHFE